MPACLCGLQFLGNGDKPLECGCPGVCDLLSRQSFILLLLTSSWEEGELFKVIAGGLPDSVF